MAHVTKRFPENVPGEFFVDTTCIDCDTCRQLAPGTFEDAGEHSCVYAQPHTEAQWWTVLHALLACPTDSIGTWHANNSKAVMADFPLPIKDGVYYTGFNSPKSYGGNSYFVQHPDGNWRIDSPKYLPHLIRRFEDLGGIRYIFLAHRDDVAEAHKYAKQFASQRLIHRAELSAQPDAEIVLDGHQPVEFSGIDDYSDARSHTGALRAALQAAILVHRRSPVVELIATTPGRFEGILLVFVGRASEVDGEAAGLRL